MELQAYQLPQIETPSVSPQDRNYVNIISITPQKGKVELVVRFPSGAVHTAELPGFAETLAQDLPAILCTRCHSGCDGLFAAELPHTETGHVLEHAILAHLEQQGLRCRAVTEWNWRRDPWGTFHIALFGKQVGLSEALQALRPAVETVETAIAESLNRLASLGHYEPAITRVQMQPGRLNGGADPDQA
ncbi:MAG: cyanophycin synthetase family protein [Chloroflexota bacterium]